MTQEEGTAMDQQGTLDRIRSVPLFSEFGNKELQRVAAIANAIGSLILAGRVPSIITASWVAA